ncbi:helix-turn-helix domain-containing protein [Streptomyces sp. NEAU-PBA10]|uniref:helix-turn-helix domain-containing protein n=1 Tax=Streptomyces TaxID=1883 RepID=UPI0035DEAE7D
MSLTQIATASGTQPSKAHRYLVSLARAGLVVRSPGSGRYDLGPAMRRLGVESLLRMDEVALVGEHLPGLRDRTTHAVNLSGWGDHGPVVVRWEYGARALPITVRSGATMPLLNSAMGGAFLTHLPEQLTDPVLRSQMEEGPLTEATRTRVTETRTETRREGVTPPRGPRLHRRRLPPPGRHPRHAVPRPHRHHPHRAGGGAAGDCAHDVGAAGPRFARAVGKRSPPRSAPPRSTMTT